MTTSALDHYADLLIAWNKKLNLTAITDLAKIRSHHFDDSMAALDAVRTAHSLIDLGTGAGLPGIVLKICQPSLRVVLVDATRKKISFCNEVIRRLNLTDIEAIQGRAEDSALQQRLGKFDAVISRATWGLDEYLAIAIAYLAAGGIIIAMRGAAWREDLEAARQTMERKSLDLFKSEEYSIGDGEKRCLLIFKSA